MSLCCEVLKALEGKTLVTAESLTGGGIGRALTAVPGSSEVYKGGVICYTNWVKENVLGVPGEILERFGAVSAQTAGTLPWRSPALPDPAAMNSVIRWARCLLAMRMVITVRPSPATSPAPGRRFATRPLKAPCVWYFPTTNNKRKAAAPELERRPLSVFLRMRWDRS